jgi:hypothetical protein
MSLLVNIFQEEVITNSDMMFQQDSDYQHGAD